MEQTYTELNEEQMLGTEIHYQCCRENLISICLKRQGEEIREAEAATCVECIEIDEKFPAGLCYFTKRCLIDGKPFNNE